MNEEQGAASAANSGPSTHSDLMHFMALVARNATETDLRFKQEQEIYQRNSSINEYARFLVNENQQLRDENQRLKSELAEAQSQIFKLQPYIKDITPDEAGSTFDNLAASIEHWVSNFMHNWTVDLEFGSRMLISKAEADPDNIRRFEDSINKHCDLIKAGRYPDTDIDIITSLVWRILKNRMFDRHASHGFSELGECIERMCNSLNTYVVPKRDPVFAQNWRAEAYNALLSRPEIQTADKKFARELANHLVTILNAFNPYDNQEQFVNECHESCVRPAIALRNRMLVSKDRFFLDLRKFCFADPKGKLQTDKAFFGCLDHMECEDILHDRKKLDLNVLHTFQDGRATETNIDDLCAVRPALMMRSVQQHGAEAAQVLRPQSMIVACGSRRDRTYFTRGAQVGCIPKLLKEIYGCDELS